MIFAFANTFIDSGFSDGLIRRIECKQEEFSTIFIFNIGVSLTLYLIIYLSAPFLAEFFREQQLVRLLRVLGIILIIDSLSLVQRVILIRNINFKLQAKISLSANSISGLVGISLAYLDFGVWSLVFQITIRQTLNSLLLWMFSQWRPTLIFSVAAFKELFGFSSKLLGTGLLNTLQNNIYYLVIGRFFSATSLGYYTRAEQFNAILTGNLNGSLQRVFLPVFASIQDDQIRLRATLKKVITSSFFITFLFSIAMVAVAKPLILILIGPKWQTSILYLQLLAIGSIFFPLSTLNFNMLKIRKRSDLILRLQLIKVLLTAILILVGIWKGIAFMLVVRIFTNFVETYLNSMYSGNFFNYSLKDQLKDISPYVFSILLIGLAMFSLNLTTLAPWAMISLQFIIGLVLFFLIFERKQFAEYMEIKKMIFELLSTASPLASKRL